MKGKFINGTLHFPLEGRIDGTNAPALEKELLEELSLYDQVEVALDAGKLQYISSAGLRVLLNLRKTQKKPVRIFNVSDEVFDIFSVTGFTDVLEVERTMRRISLNGCKKLSSGLNGEFFALSDEEMVKVYGPDIPLSDIKLERKYAQTAMVAGIPTLIPYDVVQTENGYGIVYEWAGAKSLAAVLKDEPDRLPSLAGLFAKLLLDIHSTEIQEGSLPDIKERYREWIRQIGDEGNAQTAVFSQLIETVADRGNYVHGDISLNSVLVRDGELVLFDMAGSARGHGLFDLQGIFASLVAMEKTKEGYCMESFGLSSQVCMNFWKIFFREYMEHGNGETGKMNELLLKYFVLKEQVLSQVEKKNRLRNI